MPSSVVSQAVYFSFCETASMPPLVLNSAGAINYLYFHTVSRAFGKLFAFAGQVGYRGRSTSGPEGSPKGGSMFCTDPSKPEENKEL